MGHLVTQNDRLSFHIAQDARVVLSLGNHLDIGKAQAAGHHAESAARRAEGGHGHFNWPAIHAHVL